MRCSVGATQYSKPSVVAVPRSDWSGLPPAFNSPPTGPILRSKPHSPTLTSSGFEHLSVIIGPGLDL